jgi:hypothetical protein
MELEQAAVLLVLLVGRLKGLEKDLGKKRSVFEVGQRLGLGHSYKSPGPSPKTEKEENGPDPTSSNNVRAEADPPQRPASAAERKISIGPAASERTQIGSRTDLESSETRTELLCGWKQLLLFSHSI